jgi:peroxiredoxin
LSAIQRDLARIAGYNAQVVGVSTDSIFSHQAFQKELGGLSFPLVADRWPYAAVAQAYGVFPPSKHQLPFVNDRAVFVVDKEGKIAWLRVYELGEQPENADILGVLRTLA